MGRNARQSQESGQRSVLCRGRLNVSVDKVFLSPQLLQIVEAGRFTEEETLNLIAFIQAVGKIDDGLDDGIIIFVRGDTADK